jgi:hypothetical protein
MKILNVRSPYFIEVEEGDQVAAQLKIWIWHKGETEPTEATYTLEKNIVSAASPLIIFNIAPYIAEKIMPIDADPRAYAHEESNDVWVYVRAEWYYNVVDDKTWVLVRELSCIGVNGFTSYLGGVNQDTTGKIAYLTNPDIYQYYNEATVQDDLPYFNVLIEHDGVSLTEAKWTNRRYATSSTQVLLDDSFAADTYMFMIPAKDAGIADHNYGNDVIIESELVETIQPTVTFLPICEAKYTPVTCEFINRYGGWQFLVFFKAQTNSLQVENSTFQLLPDYRDYNPLRNQFQSFNFKGKQSITLNTGWIDENFANVITDLMLSETVLLDNKPVNVKTKSTALKTRLKDKNINYTIEFDYSYNLINDVV